MDNLGAEVKNVVLDVTYWCPTCHRQREVYSGKIMYHFQCIKGYVDFEELKRVVQPVHNLHCCFCGNQIVQLRGEWIDA